MSKSSCHKHESRSFFFFILIIDFVNELLNRSLNTFDSRSLCVAFLLVRQLSLEGGHVFHPYITWFQVFLSPKLVSRQMSISFIILPDWLKNLASYYHPIRLFKKFMPRHPIRVKRYYVMLSLVFPR